MMTKLLFLTSLFSSSLRAGTETAPPVPFITGNGKRNRANFENQPVRR